MFECALQMLSRSVAGGLAAVQPTHQSRALLRRPTDALTPWAKDCTPEINTSEITVDVQWRFQMDFQWHFPREFDLSAVFSEGLA